SITQDYNCYEYFSTLKVYNRGIGGDTTEGLLTRLDTSIFQLMPDKVVLLIGTNDFSLLKTTKRKIIENINQIVQEIQQKLPKTKIILQSIYPVNENINPFSVLPRNNADIQAVNQQLAQIKGITFIDMFDLLEKDGKLNAKYSHDGLHLNALGYTKVTEKLKPYLE